MSSVWNKWMPIEKLSPKYYIDKIGEDEKNGLTIVLSDEDKEKLVIKWEGVVESYTCTEESARSIMYDHKELTEWSFFIIENSQYIKWICEQSLGILTEEDLYHFCIVSINSVVDVIARYKPLVYRGE